MRFSLIFLVCLFLYLGKCSIFVTPTPTPSLPTVKLFYNKGICYPNNHQIETKDGNTFQIVILTSGIVSLLWLSLLQLGNHVKYISFNTNLSTCTKTIEKSPDCFWSYLSLIILGLLLCECPDFSLLVFIISLLNINYSSVVNLTLKFSKIVSRVIFSITLHPSTYIL